MKSFSLRRHIRASLRLSFFVLSLLILGFFVLCFPEKKKFFFLQWWGRICLFGLGLKIHCHGTPPPSDRPHFVVSNHLGYIDIPLLWTQLYGNFIAKKEIRSWPLLGWVATRGGTIYTNRQLKTSLVSTSQSVCKKFKKQETVIAFLEGVPSNGKDILPIRSSLLQSAIDCQVPITAVYIHYSNPSDHSDPTKTIAWWEKDAPFFPHFYRLLGIKSFSAHIEFPSKPITGANRKILAENLRESLRDLKSTLTSRNNFL